MVLEFQVAYCCYIQIFPPILLHQNVQQESNFADATAWYIHHCPTPHGQIDLINVTSKQETFAILGSFSSLEEMQF